MLAVCFDWRGFCDTFGAATATFTSLTLAGACFAFFFGGVPGTDERGEPGRYLGLDVVAFFFRFFGVPGAVFDGPARLDAGLYGEPRADMTDLNFWWRQVS